MLIRKTLAGLAIVLAANAANATPVTINFDNLASGTTVGGAYAGLGVTFSNARAQSFNLAGQSAPNVLTSISAGSQPQPNTAISAVFSSAMNSVSLTGLDVGLNGFVLTAYDAATGGNVVDTEQVFGTSVGVGQFFTLQVTGANIFRVNFSQVVNVAGDGVLFDNLVFDNTAKVPEPASIALLGLGLAGLGMSRRRKAAARA